MLMMGILSNPRQVGLYSASYRILSQVLFAYYLMITVIFSATRAAECPTASEDVAASAYPAFCRGYRRRDCRADTLVRKPLVTILFGPGVLACDFAPHADCMGHFRWIF